jgi:replicative DNA helicase
MTNLSNQGSSLSPANAEAERHIIGALVLSPDEISLAMTKINREDFYYKPYSYIFDALCQLSVDGKPITPDTIANVLSGKRQVASTESLLEMVGGAGGIIDTLTGVSAGELDFWIAEVKSKSSSRDLLRLLDSSRIELLKGDIDVDNLRSKIEERLIASTGTKSSSVSMEVACDELTERLNKYFDNPDSIPGLTTGWPKFDKTIDGFQAGNVSIVYAPSSRYKSLFVANLGMLFAKQGVPGLWFTTEMPRVQVMERLLQIESQLNIKWLRRDKKLFEYREDLLVAKRRIVQYPIYFCDTSHLDVADLRAEVNRHKRWHNIDYIIIDLVDHVSSSSFKDEMVNNQRVVMSSMKAIAKDFDIHVVLVSHTAKDRGAPAQADLNVEEMIGSASKFQDVDCAISVMPVKFNMDGRLVGLERDEILNRISDTGTLQMLISVTKNRHGELIRYAMKLDWNRGGIFEPIVEQRLFA